MKESCSASFPALRHMQTAAELHACFPVIAQLHPGLTGAKEWANRAQSMRADGYRVLAAWEGDRVVAVAGYRLRENLFHGRFVYVDDLVPASGYRGWVLGRLLLQKLSQIGRDACYSRLVVATAAMNSAACEFYQEEGLSESTRGFVKPLNQVL